MPFQSTKLVAFLARQTAAPPGVDLGLVHPVAKGLSRDPELLRDLVDGPIRRPHELDRFVPELVGIRILTRLTSW